MLNMVTRKVLKKYTRQKAERRKAQEMKALERMMNNSTGDEKFNNMTSSGARSLSEVERPNPNVQPDRKL
jgi:hypothetical protein